jgi:hypothetical protein
MKLIQLGLLALAMLIVASATNAQTIPLPALIDFNSDTPGQPPNVGGINQPTSLTYAGANTTIIVESAANGIFTQPALLSIDDAWDYVSVKIGFTAVTSGLVRVEATVSFDRLTDGYFLQTAVNPSGGAVVTRLAMRDNGEIQDYEARTPVGWYEPNQPFRIRMDIDMDAKLWTVVVDNELNGFSDDEVFTNLEFSNPPSVIPHIASALASLNTFPTSAGFYGATIAYDDIFISRGSTIQASLDIKFCSDPNAFNCKSRGVLPVTIFGMEEFGVEDIDIETLRLCTEDLSACTGAPRNYSLADRGDPTLDLGVAQCAIDPATGLELDWTDNFDGYVDLDVAFESSEVRDMLDVFCGLGKGTNSESLILTGETYDGITIYSVPMDDVGIDQLLKQNK